MYLKKANKTENNYITIMDKQMKENLFEIDNIQNWPATRSLNLLSCT